MNNISLANNLSLNTPICCFSNDEQRGKEYNQLILDGLETIKKTETGRTLLEKIGKSVHQIVISTHPHTQDCQEGLKSGKMLYTKYVDESGATRPGKGSPSYIFIDPNYKTKMPVLFTEFHQKHCVQTRLCSAKCRQAEDTCVKTMSFARILFHELVHAQHNQEGINKYSGTNVSDEYRSCVETNSIELENKFAIELAQLKLGRLLDEEELDKESRHGLLPPMYPINNSSSHLGKYSFQQKKFLLSEGPRIISGLGQEFALMNQMRENREKGSSSSTQSKNDAEDIANYKV